ncbi:MAG: response regulator transcription factor [Candidatus Omnitrophota bacterium]
MDKILIIEDEQDTAKVLIKRLSVEGFSICVASDAYRGLELTLKERPDLIILDLMLPAGGGLSVLKNIRASNYSQTIPVVVLTGINDEVYKQQVLDEGVEAYLEKPYDHHTLIATIKNILKK